MLLIWINEESFTSLINKSIQGNTFHSASPSPTRRVFEDGDGLITGLNGRHQILNVEQITADEGRRVEVFGELGFVFPQNQGFGLKEGIDTVKVGHYAFAEAGFKTRNEPVGRYRIVFLYRCLHLTETVLAQVIGYFRHQPEKIGGNIQMLFVITVSCPV